MKTYLGFLIIILQMTTLLNAQQSDHTLNINMDKFCKQWENLYKAMPTDCNSKTPLIKNSVIKDEDNVAWKISFYFGFTRANYLPSDMKITNERMNITIHNFKFAERTAADYYNPRHWEKPMDALRFIDEPTNTFTLALENNNNVFFLRAYHPKFLKDNRIYSSDDEKTYRISGTIDGKEVDQEMQIDPAYEGYNALTPQTRIIGLLNTHWQMEFSLGYGKNITLFDLKKWGKIITTPDISAGIMMGQTRAVYHTSPDNYWPSETYEDKKRIHGVSLTFGNRIEWSHNKFKIFGDVRYHHAALKNTIDAKGGQAQYNWNVLAASIGIGFNLYTHKKKTNTRD